MSGGSVYIPFEYEDDERPVIRPKSYPQMKQHGMRRQIKSETDIDYTILDKEKLRYEYIVENSSKTLKRSRKNTSSSRSSSTIDNAKDIGREVATFLRSKPEVLTRDEINENLKPLGFRMDSNINLIETTPPESVSGEMKSAREFLKNVAQTVNEHAPEPENTLRSMSEAVEFKGKSG